MVSNKTRLSVKLLQLMISLCVIIWEWAVRTGLTGGTKKLSLHCGPDELMDTMREDRMSEVGGLG